MNAFSKTVDPVAQSESRSLQPSMPAAWTATVLLHPFSPPLRDHPRPDNPFFQLCVAEIVYVKGLFLSAQVAGCSYGKWWYVVGADGTQLSTDGGDTWTLVNMGWSLPTDWYGVETANATCAGASKLNWMDGPTVNWWKIPVPLPDLPPSSTSSNNGTNAATWLWFDSCSAAPVRMMFGYGPPSPTMGDPTRLAFFQMWSFTHFPVFKSYDADCAATARPTTFPTPSFPGFAVGNPNGYQNFVWSSNFGMTALMTPANEKFNPLPTRVLYVWKDDQDYSVYSDRAQNTLMLFSANPGDVAAQEALLTGLAPSGLGAPPNSDSAFLITFDKSGSSTCISHKQFPYPQEPPNWVTSGEGRIQATITNSPVVAPNTIVTIFGVLFPCSLPNYTEATYLWVWYAPQNATGTLSRPITFMQSQSKLSEGTSLALADYFYYEDFREPIDPSNFDIPASCSKADS